MPRLILITLLSLGLLMPFDGIAFTKTQAQDRTDKAQIKQLELKLQEVMPAENQPAARDALARQQAEAAVALLKLGQGHQVWPLLRHSADPSLRTYLIHSLGRLGVNPAIIIRRLESENDVSVRRALILSLGEFTGEQLPEALRRPLTSKLLVLYGDDPDPGIHSAIDWLLRSGKQGEKPRKLDWQQADRLKTIDQKLSGHQQANATGMSQRNVKR